MHAIKGGWGGQAFALATSNDSGGRKSRIRRSKEERKDMVESYIKKYQKSNNGNFPSLNLTHKEVGGSFYTVREIVREIIQENRVLAPPKVSVDEHDHSDFIERHPLGSLSIEPKTNPSVLASAVNGSEVHEKNQEFDPFVIDAVPVHHQACSEESTLLSGHQFDGPGSQRLSSEQYVNSDDESIIGEKAKDRQRKSVVMLIPDRQKDRDKVETSQAVTSHIKSNFVVEKFPIRPVFPTIYDMDGESSFLHETTETLEDQVIQEEKMSAMQSSNSLVIEKDMKNNQDLDPEYGEEKVEINLQNPSLESSNSSTVAVNSAKSFVAKGSTPIKRVSVDSKNTGLQEGSNGILERIDSETQEEASEKSIERENNTVLALIKTFFSAFVKFWTE